MTDEHIKLDVCVSNKRELFGFFADKAARELDINAREILGSLEEREALGSTGIGHGIAIPHSATIANNGTARMPTAVSAAIEQPYGMLARLARPIGFDSLDGQDVDVTFILLTPYGQASAGLKVLAAAGRAFRSDRFMREFRAALSSPDAFGALVKEEESLGAMGASV